MAGDAGEGGWRRVVYAADTDEDGHCPICEIDYTECDCPGPTQDGVEYRVVGGVLYGRMTEEGGR